MRAIASVLAVLLGVGAPAPSQEPLTVHEWGTFTSLQDENGAAIPGINSDDEPLPRFCHRIADDVVGANGVLAPVYFQGAPRCHPGVTLRLETPVLYFHLPETRSEPLACDVRVAFRGGWLTEFFPKAECKAPGIRAGAGEFGPLTPATVGELAWRRLTVGTERSGPDTDMHVWLAPRDVRAASLTAAGGESERFLFYRGVGNVAAPLRVVRSGETLEVRDAVPAALRAISPMRVASLWLVDVRADGTTAWRSLDPVVIGVDDRVLVRTAAAFADSDYGDGAALQRSMREALVGDGLFEDEADALLATWKLSYFESTGQRLFFLVPRGWTDHYLPLELSPSRARVVRTMVGRIELVTPRQRELLAKIAAGPLSDGQWFHEATRALLREGGGEPFRALWAELTSGRGTLADAGIEPPADYAAYVALGRFRNALVLDQQRRAPDPRLAAFIEAYSLEAYEPGG